MTEVDITKGFGIKVAKEGKSADTVLPKDLKFFSGFISLKVLAGGIRTTSFTTDGSGNGSKPIAHELDYIPSTIAYYCFDKNNWYNINNLIITADADITYITFKASSARANTEYQIRYLILVEEANG